MIILSISIDSNEYPQLMFYGEELSTLLNCDISIKVNCEKDKKNSNCDFCNNFSDYE